MPRHPPHAVWTPQQTNALLRIHSEEHASWVDRGRPWGGYVFKNVASRLNAIPNLFPEARTEMQCRMKLYSLKRASETMARRVSEKNERFERHHNWEQHSDQAHDDQNSDDHHDAQSKENITKFRYGDSVDNHSDNMHKRLRYNSYSHARNMANGFNPDNPEMARSPNHPYNQHPSTERHPSYENIHLNYNNNHMAPPMPPPPPPPQQQQQQQQQQQPLSHLRESNGHLQSQPYYHPSEYPYPHPPPSQSQPVRWASQLPETPNHPPPNHPPPSRFIEEYSVNQSSQQKSLHYPSRNDESKNNKYMSANTPQYRNDTDNTAHSSPPVLGRSTSPGGSSMSRISPSDHNSASPGASSGMPNKPNTLFSMQITNKPATKATPLMISDEASAMEIGSEHDSVPAIISPASDMDTETPTTSSLRTSPIPGRTLEHRLTRPNRSMSTNESYSFPSNATSPFSTATARFYPAASNGPPGPPMASTMSQGAVYSVTTEPIMRNSLYMEDRWTEMVRMQREHEHAQFELLERNRRELIAYVEKQHEVSQLQEERRWQRIVDLDIAREKKFCEREERLIATLEAADSRREKHIIDIEKRLREDADAREAHWKQTLTELSNQQTTCYTHMCELLALRKPDLTHKSAMATALTVVSTNENSNDGTVSPL